MNVLFLLPYKWEKKFQSLKVNLKTNKYLELWIRPWSITNYHISFGEKS